MRWPWEETTLDFVFDDTEVRLWIATTDMNLTKSQYFWRSSVVLSEYQPTRDVRAMADAIARRGEAYGLAAVQVRRYGVGHMIYTVPFSFGEAAE